MRSHQNNDTQIFQDSKFSFLTARGDSYKAYGLPFYAVAIKSVSNRLSFLKNNVAFENKYKIIPL